MKKILLMSMVSSLICAMSDEVRQAARDYMIDGQREMIVIVPTYNNSCQDLCIKNISSILEQNYDNYHVYIINDCSTDDTSQKIKEFLKSHPRGYKVIVIDNETRVGAMANYYTIINQVDDHLIVINIDGDDYLAHANVFSYINNVYANENVWLTYGQYVEYSTGKRGFCSGYPKNVIQKNSFRKHGLPISHLRTYYAWLFKKIDKEDLMYRGRFVSATCDKALMVPMVEMCGGRFRCIQDILYVYNDTNPISDMRIAGYMQGAVRDKILEMPPYEPLLEPIFDFATDVAGA